MGRYQLNSRNKDGKVKYYLYEEGKLLCSFTREEARQQLESIDRSSHWVGCIIKMLNKKYPLAHPIFIPAKDQPDRYSINQLTEHLEAKGYRVFKPVPVSDPEIIAYLQHLGYSVVVSPGSFLFKPLTGKRVQPLAETHKPVRASVDAKLDED